MAEKFSRKRKGGEVTKGDEFSEIPSGFFEYDTRRDIEEDKRIKAEEEARIRAEELEKVKVADARRFEEKAVRDEQKRRLQEQIFSDLEQEDVRNQLEDLTARRLELEVRLEGLQKELVGWDRRLKKLFNPERKFSERRRLKAELADVEGDLAVIDRLENDKLFVETGQKQIDVVVLGELTDEYKALIALRDEAKRGILELRDSSDDFSKEKKRIAELKYNLVRRQIAEASREMLGYAMGEMAKEDVEPGEHQRKYKKGLANGIALPVFEKEKGAIAKKLEDVLAATLLSKFGDKTMVVANLTEKEKEGLVDASLEVAHDVIKKELFRSMSRVENEEFQKTGEMIGAVINRYLKALLKEVLSQNEEIGVIDAKIRRILADRELWAGEVRQGGKMSGVVSSLIDGIKNIGAMPSKVRAYFRNRAIEQLNDDPEIVKHLGSFEDIKINAEHLLDRWYSGTSLNSWAIKDIAEELIRNLDLKAKIIVVPKYLLKALKIIAIDWSERQEKDRKGTGRGLKIKMKG